ncbi:MAG: DNA repair protein RecN [Elusimicrobiota bacterium]|jgi:DNA repair protein RecN (Recombination protein N)|nr:DNA repair protein RecN [Elusimicrobiota bacterium]
MLTSLSIKNYALIDDLNLDFNKGFIVITGETGSGKSILIEAVELLTGARADTSAIRSGANICYLSGSFVFENPKIAEFLDNLSIPRQDNSILIRRTIEHQGKSKAFINDFAVNISTLAALGDLLINFHSQDEKHALNSGETQLMLLDARIDDLQKTLAQTAQIYEEASKLKSELEALNLSESDRARKIDLYSFQIEEINNANLKPSEDEQLSADLPKLKNAEKISALCAQINTVLYSGENTVLSQMMKTKKDIEALNSLGAQAEEALTLIDQSYYQIEEANRSVENILAKSEINPQKLNEALEREELIKKLKRKYGANITEILQYKDKIQNELETLNNLGANTAKLEKDIEEKMQVLLSLCKELSQKRKKESSTFCNYVKKELSELEIKDAVFETRFEEKSPSANGYDRIEFMFCANKGEALLPLKNTASGGELSRVMLALELSSQFNKDQTTVFDEIDAGTGGKTGEKIGKKLGALSKKKQVFSITHLAQVAAFADTHIKIYKDTQNSRTFTKTRILSQEEHIEEIARMISGEQITQSALEHAQNLIKLSKTAI